MMELILSFACIIAWGYLEISFYLVSLHFALNPNGQTKNSTPKIFVEIADDEPVQVTPNPQQPIVEEAFYIESQLDKTEEAFLAELFNQQEVLMEQPEQPQQAEVVEFPAAEEQGGKHHQNKTSAVWQVEVIGAEGGYIHVLHEGSRRWLFVGEGNRYPIYSILNVHMDFSFDIEDVLAVEVLYEPMPDHYQQHFDEKYAIIL